MQDQWRITPSLTANFGVRYDTETLYNGLEQKAFILTNEWAPRFGVTWDFAGDGTSKLYASAGRFYYAIPTDLNVRVFTANTAYRTFSYDINDLNQVGPACATGAPTPGCVARDSLIQVGSLAGEPVGSGHQGLLPGRVHDRRREGDRSDPVGRPEGHVPLARPDDRGPLRPELPTGPTGIFLRAHEPGRDGHRQPGRDRASTAPATAPATRPTRTPALCTGPGQGTPIPPAKRIFKGIELVVRKQFTNEIWAQLSYLGSSLTGNYSGAIREASGQTDPGINADFDYADFIAQLLGPPRARPAEPGPPRRGLQRVRGVSRPACSSTSARARRPRSRATTTAVYPQELYLDPARLRRTASRPTTR